MSVDEVKLSRKGKLIVVAGINGVGKTTVLNSVKQLTKEIEVVNYGDEMFSIASQRGWVQNRDQIRKLPLERQLLLQKEAAQNLSLKAKEKI
jgi:Archaeal adenylate kinase